MKLYNILGLLEEHTDEDGCYSLSLNEHKGVYERDVISYYITNNEELEDKKHVDWTKNIYWLSWYKNTPVGFYNIIGNTLDDLYKQIIEIIGETK